MTVSPAAVPAQIRVCCAWCQRVIRDGDPEYVSHGICDPCCQKHFPAAKTNGGTT